MQPRLTVSRDNLDTVRFMNTRPTCWIITEGIAGTENQCLGLAEALGISAVVKRVKLRAPWKQLSPYFRIANHWALDPAGDSIDPPYPDLVIASGRKSIAPALAVKKLSGGKTIIVQIQDPRISPKHFDLVIVPQHDPTRGENVMTTIGALHRVTPEKLERDASAFPALAHLPGPRIAVLIGGNSKSHKMTSSVTSDLCDKLLELKNNTGGSLMVTASRRTGLENRLMLQDRLSGDNIFFWDGTGANPYFAFLHYADAIVVTNDSVSMASEALETGKPTYVYALPGGGGRLDVFHELLLKQGFTRRFDGRLESWTYVAPHDTLAAASAVQRLLQK